MIEEEGFKVGVYEGIPIVPLDYGVFEFMSTELSLEFRKTMDAVGRWVEGIENNFKEEGDER